MGTGNRVKEICEIHGEYVSQCVSKSDIGKEFDIYTKCPKCEAGGSRIPLSGDGAVLALSIPKRYKNKSFENYEAVTSNQAHALFVCQGYCEYFDSNFEDGKNLLLCGKPGTGKTHLAYSIAKAIAKSGRSIIYTTAYKMIKEIRDTWDHGSRQTEQHIIRKFTAPDLLIIDEVGVQSNTENERTLMFQVLDARYQDMKPVLIVGNLTFNELTEYMGERIIDRLREGGGSLIPLDWESYRKK